MATALTHKMFVNLPVKDLRRSVEFFKKLGFTFDPRFTDGQSTCMIVGDDAYVMLLEEQRFKDFIAKPIADASRATEGIFSVEAGSKQEVDELVTIALGAGGRPAAQTLEMDSMYNRSFYDPDGHHWEAFFMDPLATRTEKQADS